MFRPFNIMKKKSSGYTYYDVSYEAYTTIAVTSNSLQINVPTGVSDGDLIILFLAGRASSITLEDLQGWTLIDHTFNVGSGTFVYCFYKIASSEPAYYNWRWAEASTRVRAINILLKKSGGDWIIPGSSTVVSATETRTTNPQTIETSTISIANKSLLLAQWFTNANSFTEWPTDPADTTLIFHSRSSITSALVYYQNFVSSSEVTKELIFAGSTTAMICNSSLMIITARN